jgi:hypothetical protein
LPVTGKQMIDIMKLVGGGIIDPQLQQMINVGGSLFSNRTFIIGYEFSTQPSLSQIPSSMNTQQDLLKVLDAMLAEVALIWSPGQGMSIRQMLMTGKIDPVQLQRLMAALAPEALNEWWKQIPNLLPALTPLLGGAQPMHVMGNLDVKQSFSDPSTPPTTGLKVVDEVGDAQDTTPPSEGASKSTVTGEGMDDASLYLAIGAIVFGGFLIWHGYRTR